MSPLVRPPLPRWLQAIAGGADQPRPYKGPPPAGALLVDRWNIPPSLRNQRAWAVWKYTQDVNGRWSKPPSQPSGEPADGRDEATWASFDACFEAYRQGPWDGLSFCVDPRWGLVGVDLDHVSEHPTEAPQIVAALDSYTEQSPGGDGLRIFVRGRLPEGRRRRDWVEMYDHHRFLSVTGQRVGAHDVPRARQSDLEYVWRRWLQRG
jgi:primase-polymerase (primpol)-like protein